MRVYGGHTHQTIKVDGDDEVRQAHLSANKLPGNADRFCICKPRITLSVSAWRQESLLTIISGLQVWWGTFGTHVLQM